MLISISGKVESLVAAWLLKKQGRQLRGVYFDLTQDENEKNKILEYERKLGISIQIVPVQDLLLTSLAPYFEKTLQTGAKLNLKKLIHQKIFFPELFKILEQHHFQGIAGGYRVVIQNDPISQLTKIYGYEDPKEDEADFILGLSQKEISLLELPLGSIPMKMMRRIAVELELDQEQSYFQIDWKALQGVLMSHFTKDMDKSIDLFGDNGSRIGTCSDYTRYTLGDAFHLAGVVGGGNKPSEALVVMEIDSKTRHMKVGDLNRRVIHELELSDVAWITRADLGFTVLKTFMVIKNNPKKIPVKLIQFEENKVKAILETPLKGLEAALYNGDQVMWMNGNEILGGARVTRVR